MRSCNYNCNVSGKRSHSLLALYGSFYVSIQRGFISISSCVSMHLHFQPLRFGRHINVNPDTGSMLTLMRKRRRLTTQLLNSLTDAILPRRHMHKRSHTFMLTVTLLLFISLWLLLCLPLVASEYYRQHW